MWAGKNYLGPSKAVGSIFFSFSTTNSLSLSPAVIVQRDMRTEFTSNPSLPMSQVSDSLVSWCHLILQPAQSYKEDKIDVSAHTSIC